MNELQEYIYNNITFDKHDDKNGEDFDCVLFDEIDRLTVWTDDCIEFINIDMQEVLNFATKKISFDSRFNNLATERTPEKNIINYSYIGGCVGEIKIDFICHNAMVEIAFNQIYNELKNKYMDELEA